MPSERGASSTLRLLDSTIPRIANIASRSCGAKRPGSERKFRARRRGCRECLARLQILRRLDTSNGRQDHTFLPYAAARLRQKAWPDSGAVILRKRYRSRDDRNRIVPRADFLYHSPGSTLLYRTQPALATLANGE